MDEKWNDITEYIDAVKTKVFDEAQSMRKEEITVTKGNLIIGFVCAFLCGVIAGLLIISDKRCCSSAILLFISKYYMFDFPIRI